MAKKNPGKENKQDKYKREITPPATVSANGINPPIPEFLWDQYEDDQELLDAVQPMTLRPIPLNGGETIEWLYEWMRLREFEGVPLITPRRAQEPPFNGKFGDSWQTPNLPPDFERSDVEHRALLDALFVEIEQKRININTHQNVKQAGQFADMLEGVLAGGYISNPILLEIYEFGGGVPWRQLTVEDITNERARRDANETEQIRRDKFDQDISTINNEILDPAAATYDRATYSAALTTAKVEWDKLTDP